jgi:MoxR-like ATPase
MPGLPHRLVRRVLDFPTGLRDRFARHNTPVPDSLADRVRLELRQAADTIEPSPDALARIQAAVRAQGRGSEYRRRKPDPRAGRQSRQ